jgi:glutamine amidotransferase
MKNINERIPLPELIEQIRLGKMFLGICVGMQVLGSVGYEFEKTNGLSLIEGEIVSMQSDDLALPHVGWNSVKQVHSHDLFRDIPNDSDFYFVHSYKFQEKFERNLLGLTEYGKDFVSVIAEQNILGVQFHPEKSQTHGLKLLRNFVDIK